MGELRAGQPLIASLEHCQELWPEFEPVVAAARLGADVPARCAGSPRARGAEGLREVASAWQVSERSGAGLAAALAQVALTARERQGTRRLVQGELASAQATARLVAVLPWPPWRCRPGSADTRGTSCSPPRPGWPAWASGPLFAFAGLLWIDRIAARVLRGMSARGARPDAGGRGRGGGWPCRCCPRRTARPGAPGRTPPRRGAPRAGDRPCCAPSPPPRWRSAARSSSAARSASVAGLAAAAVCWRVVGRLEPPAVRRRRERLAAAVPHVVDLMAACLAAGLSPAAALEEIPAAVGPRRATSSRPCRAGCGSASTRRPSGATSPGIPSSAVSGAAWPARWRAARRSPTRCSGWPTTCAVPPAPTSRAGPGRSGVQGRDPARALPAPGLRPGRRGAAGRRLAGRPRRPVSRTSSPPHRPPPGVRPQRRQEPLVAPADGRESGDVNPPPTLRWARPRRSTMTRVPRRPAAHRARCHQRRVRRRHRRRLRLRLRADQAAHQRLRPVAAQDPVRPDHEGHRDLTVPARICGRRRGRAACRGSRAAVRRASRRTQRGLGDRRDRDGAAGAGGGGARPGLGAVARGHPGACRRRRARDRPGGRTGRRPRPRPSALGRRVAPDGATVTVREDGDTVVVRVRATGARSRRAVRLPARRRRARRGGRGPRSPDERRRRRRGASAGSATVLAVAWSACWPSRRCCSPRSAASSATSGGSSPRRTWPPWPRPARSQAGGDPCAAARRRRPQRRRPGSLRRRRRGRHRPGGCAAGRCSAGGSS